MEKINASPSRTFGYFHWPPVWIGEQPTTLDKNALNTVVFQATTKSGIMIQARCRGTITFDFSEATRGNIPPEIDYLEEQESIESAIYLRTAILNVHLACLYRALDEVQRVGLSKMVAKPTNILRSQSDGSVLSLSHESEVTAQAHFMECDLGIPAEFSFWKEKRALTLELNTIQRSIELFELVLEHTETNTIDLVNLYLHSCKSYEDHDYSLSLIQAWAIIEKLLHVFWEGYLEQLQEIPNQHNGKKFMNNSRKENLLKGRDYSASIIIEILSLTNIIPFSLYEELNKARRVRNKWIHELKPATREDAEDSLRLASDMLSYVYKVDLRSPSILNLMY